jgi:hypothetical protein
MVPHNRVRAVRGETRCADDAVAIRPGHDEQVIVHAAAKGDARPLLGDGHDKLADELGTGRARREEEAEGAVDLAVIQTGEWEARRVSVGNLLLRERNACEREGAEEGMSEHPGE